MHGRKGTQDGGNVQNVVDEKHGMIVSSDVVNENNDSHQFAAQINQANETLGKPCETACADCGYSNVDELEKIDAQNINVVVPNQREAAKKELGPFDVSKFSYDHEKDCYRCPAGEELKYRNTEVKRSRKVYRTAASTCRQCSHFGVCTTNTNGRKVTRLLKEELREKLSRQYQRPDNQAIYRLRKQKHDLPSGH